MIDYGAIFLIGFLSSFGHCIGMCGGFVTAYSLKLTADAPAAPRGWTAMIAPHFLYNIGRITTYVFLGFLFGITGEALRVAVDIRQFQAGLQIVAGILMVFIALDMGGWLPPILTERFPGYAQFKRLSGKLFRRVNRRNIFGLGLVLGFIPCGLVYAAGAKAAAAGGIPQAMLTMLAFGLGTLPALLMVGLGANAISARFRQRVFRFATVLVIALGVLTAYKGALKFQMNPAAGTHQHDVECTH